MPPFDQIRAILAAWRSWRLSHRTAPIRAEIMEVEIELAAARRLKGRTRDLERKHRAMKTKQLRMEMGR